MNMTEPARVAQALQVRSATIQFLKALEDELIEVGALSPDDRSCLTRQERRALERAGRERPLAGV